MCGMEINEEIEVHGKLIVYRGKEKTAELDLCSSCVETILSKRKSSTYALINRLKKGIFRR